MELVARCASYLNNRAYFGEYLPYYTESKIWLSNDYRRKDLPEQRHKEFFKELGGHLNFDLDEYARNYNRSH